MTYQFRWTLEQGKLFMGQDFSSEHIWDFYHRMYDEIMEVSTLIILGTDKWTYLPSVPGVPPAPTVPPKIDSGDDTKLMSTVGGGVISVTGMAEIPTNSVLYVTLDQHLQPDTGSAFPITQSYSTQLRAAPTSDCWEKYRTQNTIILGFSIGIKTYTRPNVIAPA